MVVYSMVRAIGKISLIQFFKEMSEAMLLRFHASSVGTLPFNMECTKRLGVKKEVSAQFASQGDHQYGWNRDLSGVLYLSPRYSAWILPCPAADRYPDGGWPIGTAGRRTQGGNHAVHGASERGTSAGRIALCCRIDRILDIARTTVNIEATRRGMQYASMPWELQKEQAR